MDFLVGLAKQLALFSEFKDCICKRRRTWTDTFLSVSTASSLLSTLPYGDARAHRALAIAGGMNQGPP